MVNKGRKIFGILLAIILIVVLGLGGYLAYNYLSSYINEKDAAEAVDEFENSIIVVAMEDETNQNTEEPQNTSSSTGTTTKNSTSGVKYKGYDIIGTIQIPSISVKYPIIADTSPSAMDTAIVFLYGPGLNKVGNSVIVGHNYRNGGFFGKNKNLKEGNKIYITDSSGNKLEYTITKKYITDDMDFTYATRDTAGKREISLSTCTNDPTKRLIIWAKES